MQESLFLVEKILFKNKILKHVQFEIFSFEQHFEFVIIFLSTGSIKLQLRCWWAFASGLWVFSFRRQLV